MSDSAHARRDPLSASRIVSAALAVADAEGLDALTMRRLARELGAAPMAAYAHFPGKRALLAAVVDAVVGEVELPEPDGRWRKPLRRMALSLRRALVAHPALMPAVHACGAHGPNALALLDRAHAVLRQAGFPADQAAGAVDTLYAFALGAASIELAEAALDPAARHARFAALPTAGYPDLAASLPHVLATDRETRFRYGVDRILDGLAAAR
jgi:TetR/AcrR family transcriptional regulator, tetracycline repressor protein